MINEMEKADIQQMVWQASGIFHNVIGPVRIKDYVLSVMFLRYVSQHDDRFNIPPTSRYEYLLEHQHDNDLGKKMDNALTGLVAANRDVFGGKEAGDVFRSISFNSADIGEPAARNARIKQLLSMFGWERWSLRMSAGETFIHLLTAFAREAGKKGGGFYSPPELSTLLVRLMKNSARGITICDPVCGTGSLLVKAGQAAGSDAQLFGQELNGNNCALAIMNTLMHGAHEAHIRWGDTLRSPKLIKDRQLQQFDVVVCVPPFNQERWGAGEAMADVFHRFKYGVPPKGKGDWAYISHALAVAREETGKVGIVVPHGVLFRGAGEGRIRQAVIQDNLLEAVIGLPVNLLYDTDIPSAILIFNKGKQSDNTLFIDASRDYENDKSQNRLRPQDIDHITDTYNGFAKGELKPGCVEKEYAFVASPQDMAARDYDLSIAKYVEIETKSTTFDIDAIRHQINELKEQLADVQARKQECLKLLGI